MEPSSSICAILDDDAPKRQSSLEIIEIEEVTPSPPPLPLIELVIVFMLSSLSSMERRPVNAASKSMSIKSFKASNFNLLASSNQSYQGICLFILMESMYRTNEHT